MLRNFSPKASSMNPRITLTEFSHPPDFGRDVSQDGNMANRVKGSAKASPKPSIPTIGWSNCPPADCTRTVPTMGPVQENETRTVVKAMKNGPLSPPLSACWSDLLIIQLGRFISNIPKNQAAKNRKIKKNSTLGIQCVLMKLAIPGPKITATIVPITAKIATMDTPKNMASNRDFFLDFSPCMKKDTVMGIMGNTQGVSNAMRPLPNAIQNSFQRLPDELADDASFI